jgi:hypothetical protein
MDDERKQRSLRQAKRKAIEALDTSIVNFGTIVYATTWKHRLRLKLME